MRPVGGIKSVESTKGEMRQSPTGVTVRCNGPDIELLCDCVIVIYIYMFIYMFIFI